MFGDELKILSKIRHPNIVQFVGACTISRLAIVTEYMENGSLRQFIEHAEVLFQTKPFLRIRICFDMVKGMCYLHGMRPAIIHGDLTSNNVLLDGHYRAKISDFGLAKLHIDMEEDPEIPRMGCFTYLAPEVFKGLSCNEKSDVFSFAIVLWELWTGEDPNAGMKPKILAEKVHSGFRLPFPSTCPPKWQCLIAMCWSQDPATRPSFNDVFHLMKTFENTPAAINTTDSDDPYQLIL